jgi:hypothetical protein
MAENSYSILQAAGVYWFVHNDIHGTCLLNIYFSSRSPYAEFYLLSSVFVDFVRLLWLVGRWRSYLSLANRKNRVFHIDTDERLLLGNHPDFDHMRKLSLKEEMFSLVPAGDTEGLDVHIDTNEQLLRKTLSRPILTLLLHWALSPMK